MIPTAEIIVKKWNRINYSYQVPLQITEYFEEFVRLHLNHIQNLLTYDDLDEEQKIKAVLEYIKSQQK
jgi:hypothetical protein